MPSIAGLVWGNTFNVPALIENTGCFENKRCLLFVYLTHDRFPTNLWNLSINLSVSSHPQLWQSPFSATLSSLWLWSPAEVTRSHQDFLLSPVSEHPSTFLCTKPRSSLPYPAFVSRATSSCSASYVSWPRAAWRFTPGPVPDAEWGCDGTSWRSWVVHRTAFHPSVSSASCWGGPMPLPCLLCPPGVWRLSLVQRLTCYIELNVLGSRDP